jgi:GNAT superfamily N-acetyltransferase
LVLIRAARFEDIPALLEMGARFSNKARLIEHVGYDPENMADTFAILIEGGHPIFLSENGAIGGTSSPHPFNHKHIIAQELFWWAEGGGGLRLLEAFEDYAREHCHSVRMLALHALEPERVGAIYRRRGYAPLEYGWIKVF